MEGSNSEVRINHIPNRFPTEKLLWLLLLPCSAPISSPYPQRDRRSPPGLAKSSH